MRKDPEKVLKFIVISGVVLIAIGFFAFISLKSTDDVQKPDNSSQDLDPSEEELYACESDSDCLMVNGDCCGCELGGSSIAINAKYADYWNKKLVPECKEFSCPDITPEDIRCDFFPQCLKNKCSVTYAM